MSNPTSAFEIFDNLNNVNSKDIKVLELGIKNSVIFDPTNRPKFNETQAEAVIQGQDNTWIVLGRDRPGGWNSGYGSKGHLKAGAIDIVVGRFSSLDSRLLTGRVNPSTTADAARVYLSQKSDPDINYRLPDGVSGKSMAMSAAIIKADAVRIIARDSLKLVTRTDGKYSTGKESYRNTGVQLLVDDGGAHEVQPIPKGKNLVAALDELATHIQKLNGIVANFWQSQNEFNDQISKHTHFENFWGAPGSVSPGVVLKYKGVLLDGYLNTEQALSLNASNLELWKPKYLKPSNSLYINSAFHHLN